MRLPEPARPVAIAPGIRRRMSGVLILILGCMLSGCTGVFLQPDRVAHFPGRSVETPVTDVWITAPDGTALHALYLPARGRARATVLYLHGNAENLSSHIHLARWLPGRGYNLLALDYRGYGRSEGRAGVAGVHQDVQAALSCWSNVTVRRWCSTGTAWAVRWPSTRRQPRRTARELPRSLPTAPSPVTATLPGKSSASSG